MCHQHRVVTHLQRKLSRNASPTETRLATNMYMYVEVVTHQDVWVIPTVLPVGKLSCLTDQSVVNLRLVTVENANHAIKQVTRDR